MRCQLEELQRHAKQDRGLYLNPYKQAKCNNEEKKNAKESTKMPLGAITNMQLDVLARRMRVL